LVAEEEDVLGEEVLRLKRRLQDSETEIFQLKRELVRSHASMTQGESPSRAIEPGIRVFRAVADAKSTGYFGIAYEQVADILSPVEFRVVVHALTASSDVPTLARSLEISPEAVLHHLNVASAKVLGDPTTSPGAVRADRPGVGGE
jgi:hypothetical protein